ncbi:MAG: hypothetical protein JWQ10_2854 [Herbaspirillum sp.]|nr:hypothetical protein [Herbaspirillum sp.]
MTTTPPQLKAMRMASWITAVNVLVASGYAIAGLVHPAAILPASDVPTEASAIFAMYAAARTLPLAVITLVVIFKRMASALLVLGFLAGVIQLSDSIVGIFQHDPGKIFGPFLIACFQFYAVFLLRRLRN